MLLNFVVRDQLGTAIDIGQSKREAKTQYRPTLKHLLTNEKLGTFLRSDWWLQAGASS